MGPNSFGKKLGIGLRVAGNIARDRAQQAAKEAARQCAAQPRPAESGASSGVRKAEQAAVRGRDYSRELGRGIGRGSRQFSQSFFRPFAHASSVLWLEITGCFFALFAAFFGQNIYKLHTQYAAGPGHNTFLLYCFLTLIFLYFSVSSFVRARRRSRRQRAGH